ncbi:MAG: polysialyltransferase family glycosyltransferase [Clostridium septicum]|uniref:polysialyltransferase family glycosyltransferase n=1 Tax=Clostridium septicum TaxID=1504 RepID=UPI00258A341F|nr:polysialyltransferase family glycosyltransferase [Clostridium septicum]MDU1314688.1 polysialyltransferase family glycosyltransferase [Clostridium septicum]
MNNLFIVNTPYHITLSLAIINAKGLKNNVLIVLRDFNFVYKDYSYLNESFDEIIEINGLNKLNKASGAKKILEVIKNLFLDIYTTKKAIKNLRALEFDNIFFANDSYVQVQALIHKLKGENTEISYMEDGIACYLSDDKTITSNSLFNKIKIIYNSILITLFNMRKKYENGVCYGSNSYVDKCYVLYPEFIRKELLVKSIQKIEDSNFENVLRMSYTKSNIIINDSIIFLVDLFEENLACKYEEVIKYLSSKNKKIYIKYHPRETNFYLDKYLNCSIIKLQSNKNIEALLIGTNKNVVLTGKGSTAFLTLSKISKNQYVVIGEAIGLTIDSRVKKILTDIGVKFPMKIEEV